jgi:hypothetical protein
MTDRRAVKLIRSAIGSHTSDLDPEMVAANIVEGLRGAGYVIVPWERVDMLNGKVTGEPVLAPEFGDVS